MAISGLQVINIGLQNESTGSDSLYTAFSKSKTNFATVFACASPYNTFTGNTGITTTTNSTTGTVDILNTGVTQLIAGTGISLDQTTGNITISSTGGGGGGGGTVTSVGILPASNTRIVVSGSPIVSAGNIQLDLAVSGVTAGVYNVPTITVDAYGRVTAAASGSIAGTVTSVAVSPGFGIQVTGSPITTAGTISIQNTGVTRLSAGTGITLSSSSGNVTVSTSVTGGTVTSVALSSSTLTVSGSPVVSNGTLVVDLPSTITLAGNISSGNANLGNLTTSNYYAGTLTTAAQPNITSVGTLTSLSVTGNIAGGNLLSNGIMALNGSEDLADAGAANVAITASYFSTGAAETATLAAGTVGQLKTFMMVADLGDMVITVTNAGWKTSGTGTMTFGSIGTSCTLQYINSKWFCIGNNGVAFA
jgi:hypothetical protein